MICGLKLRLSRSPMPPNTTGATHHRPPADWSSPPMPRSQIRRRRRLGRLPRHPPQHTPPSPSPAHPPATETKRRKRPTIHAVDNKTQNQSRDYTAEPIRPTRQRPRRRTRAVTTPKPDTTTAATENQSEDYTENPIRPTRQRPRRRTRAVTTPKPAALTPAAPAGCRRCR